VIARAFAAFGGLSLREIEDLALCDRGFEVRAEHECDTAPERYAPETVRRIAEYFVETSAPRTLPAYHALLEVPAPSA
jgi:hypothetical protein